MRPSLQKSWVRRPRLLLLEAHWLSGLPKDVRAAEATAKATAHNISRKVRVPCARQAPTQTKRLIQFHRYKKAEMEVISHLRSYLHS